MAGLNIGRELLWALHVELLSKVAKLCGNLLKIVLSQDKNRANETFAACGKKKKRFQVEETSERMRRETDRGTDPDIRMPRFYVSEEHRGIQMIHL